MQPIELQGIRPGELILASYNYIDALRLPNMGRVLIVMDKPGLDPDTSARRWMASKIDYLLRGRNEVKVLEFDDQTYAEEMNQATLDALNTLNSHNSSQVAVTVAYIGKAWEKRVGFYTGVADFERNTKTKTRLAISVGLNRADIKTLLKIKSETRNIITTQVEKELHFFREHLHGSFAITTKHDERDYLLRLKYNTSQSPFHPDWGVLNDNSPSPMDFGDCRVISNAANIPGGEVFATPYPFSHTQGQFVAREVLFTVKNGLITDAQSLSDNPPVDDGLLLIINEINFLHHPLPVSELGLGIFALAGIRSEPGSSVLSVEKDGPHIGVGSVPGESTEAEEILVFAGKFHHGDLVLDHPSITFQEKQTDTPVQFYPPE